MPIYEYACSACGHRTDILHGVNEPGPHFCPACGTEGSMRKAFAPPAIVFKGSGWAKKDRASTTKSASKRADDTSGPKAEPAKGETAGAGGSSTGTSSGATTGSSD